MFQLEKRIPKKLHVVIWIVGFTVVGIGLLIFSKAASPYISIEAENATLSSVTSTTDGTASGSNFITFKAPVVTGSALTINASHQIKPFDKKIKGIGLANWTFTKNWGKPFVGEVQGLPQAIQAIDPGVIRYAGGLWANYVGFDRTKTQLTAYTSWTYNGQTYSFNYGTDELHSLDTFAKSVGADVMLQVNMSNNDPAMWADMVRYAKEQALTSIKYYEFGNELDLETFTNSADKIDPPTYAARVVAYQQAMLAVDATVQFVGGVSAEATDTMRTAYSCCGNQVSQYISQAATAAHGAGKDLYSVSYHWYQNAASLLDVQTWSYGIASSSTDWWRNEYSRQWSELGPSWVRSQALVASPNTKVGVSELGVNSTDGPINGNHLGALWFSDVLGRLAYSGADWVTQWDSYASSGETFSLLYPDSDTTLTPVLNARPSYAAYLMYSKYFGDQMVESATYDASKISIWASKDSKDLGKLKLRITNLSDSPLTVPIQFAGFSITSGQAYVLSSTNPTDLSAASATSQAPTTINGVKINAVNVAASLASIVPINVAASGTSFSYTFPAYSSTAIVLSGN